MHELSIVKRFMNIALEEAEKSKIQLFFKFLVKGKMFV